MGTRWGLAALVAAAMLGVGSGAGTEAKAEYSRRTPIVEAVEKTRAGIVTVKVEKKTAWGRREIAGTGVIVDERGYVVTNHHVVENSAGVVVVLNDGTMLAAETVHAEALNDLAVLRVRGKGNLHALGLGPGSDLMVGETVIAVGHPFGYTNTVSTGIISAVRRDVNFSGTEMLRNLIQVNASINPGNSGGPLLNINGEVIGINVAIRDGAQGIAFALNADTVKEVLSRALAAEKLAGVSHGLQIRESVGGDGQPRQQVLVERDGNTLRRGDTITAVGGQPVLNRFDVERSLWDRKPGEKVEVKVLREGRELTVPLTLTRASSPALRVAAETPALDQ